VSFGVTGDAIPPNNQKILPFLKQPGLGHSIGLGHFMGSFYQLGTLQAGATRRREHLAALIGSGWFFCHRCCDMNIFV